MVLTKDGKSKDWKVGVLFTILYFDARFERKSRGDTLERMENWLSYCGIFFCRLHFCYMILMFQEDAYEAMRMKR